jgi:hypothetical protein
MTRALQEKLNIVGEQFLLARLFAEILKKKADT